MLRGYYKRLAVFMAKYIHAKSASAIKSPTKAINWVNWDIDSEKFSVQT
jgi:hypothetical protein